MTTQAKKPAKKPLDKAVIASIAKTRAGQLLFLSLALRQRHRADCDLPRFRRKMINGLAHLLNPAQMVVAERMEAEKFGIILKDSSGTWFHWDNKVDSPAYIDLYAKLAKAGAGTLLFSATGRAMRFNWSVRIDDLVSLALAQGTAKEEEAKAAVTTTPAVMPKPVQTKIVAPVIRPKILTDEEIKIASKGLREAIVDVNKRAAAESVMPKALTTIKLHVDGKKDLTISFDAEDRKTIGEIVMDLMTRAS